MRLPLHATIGAVIFLTAWIFPPAPSARAAQNPMFGYPHLLASPFTLPAGRLIIGTEAALGVTDFFEVGTSVLRDFYKIYNASAKLSLVDFEGFALAVTGGFETYNYRDIYPTNPDLTVTSLLPGAVAAFELLPRFAIFAGGNLSYTKANLRSSGIETSGYIRGARLESDFGWAYNPPGATGSGKRSSGAARGVGNVLSGGLSYDVTYSLVGMGISHHWPGLHLGAHYYPNADRYKLQPIIAGGAVVDL
ncbi:MAG: hypothetical protein HYW49_04425 [Deltaproteobacteria bacterium]|nr:hypothetical protein [Deltaproteobacteria bacterium]